LDCADYGKIKKEILMVADQQDSGIPHQHHQYTLYELDNLLHTYIKDYVSNNSFVKLEASLTEMIYQQFKEHYFSADDTEKKRIEGEIEQYIPDRASIKRYLDGNGISIQKINTIANFFGLNYSVHNHDPVFLYQQKQQAES
jgi:hypothetical protein